MFLCIIGFTLQMCSYSTKQNEWLLLNQEGKVTTPLDVAKSMDSDVTIYVVMVGVVLSLDIRKRIYL